ncbi:alpha/beta hydrolase family protein [Paraglaciecola sp. L3A3]|uniref:alpha/beta hydrolase n=1 Tax=Paraglaciecola sp. L3A3 TaxID=2686358 RepID=UPI00131C8B59|nr:alpha/beta hydrolase-fold protein [Paraglaciecola sp. L3A3]
MTVTRIEKSNPKYARKNTLTLTLHSDNLNRRQDVTVYNPYSQQKDLPIVILLHGVYGNNWVWMDLGGAHQVYENLRKQGLSEFVLVMPSDGGIWEGSGYLPLQQHGNFEKWIMDDVINTVIDTVDSVSSDSNLYISGLSMGGFGALRLGAKYAKRFSGISAHSSITKVEDLAIFTDVPLSQYQTADANESDIIYWCQQNKADLPPLRLDCGTSDDLIESNRDLVSKLQAAKILHQYQELAGCHEWEYWNKNLVKTLHFFNQIETNR